MENIFVPSVPAGWKNWGKRDNVMALDRSSYIENYLDEIRENLTQVDNTVISLKKDPENQDLLKQLLRLLHSIKGSSRMLKFNNMEAMAHGLENIFKGVNDGRYGITRDLVELVFMSTDYFRAGADVIASEGIDNIFIDRLVAVFDQAASNEPFSIEKARYRSYEDDENAAHDKNTKPELEGGEHETIRIKTRKVNEIIKQLNSLIIRQFQFKKENDLLEELEKKFRRLEILKKRGNLGEKYDKLAGESLKLILKLRKDFLEELPLLERQTFEVQEEILSLRMLPLEMIFGSMPKMVEEIAMNVNKEVNLTMSGTDILIDKVILENTHDPIVHIIRNAVDHGIETIEERRRKSKPDTGSIDIKCSTEGGNIVIRISDDGRGINYQELRTRALERYTEREEEIRLMDEEALNTFLFQSGFSTRKEISDLSGRGVGLDIVRTNVDKIKGKVTLASKPDEGTEFVMSLPLSLSTVEGFFVTSGNEKFLVPSNFVREVIVIHDEEVIDLLSRKAFKLRNRIIPFYNLSSLLDTVAGGVQEKNFMLVVEAFGETIGIVVDSVIRFSSLVHKPLPSNLADLKPVQGVVFDESFNIVTILHVPELINRFKRLKNIDARKKYSSESKEYKRILVVDDSITTREIEKSILELENYNVITAIDGIDGLEKADEQYYHLIITDIQMPRMDGLTFVDNLRKREKYMNTPIIVVSSADDEKMRLDFKKVNVNSFIIKSEFERGNLLDEVKLLIG